MELRIRQRGTFEMLFSKVCNGLSFEGAIFGYYHCHNLEWVILKSYTTWILVFLFKKIPQTAVTSGIPVGIPAPPHSHRIRGFLCSFLITRTPLSVGKKYTPYLGYWLPLAITTTKNRPFPGFLWNLPETTPPKYPLSRENEKMEKRMRPPYAFDWGGPGHQYDFYVYN